MPKKNKKKKTKYKFVLKDIHPSEFTDDKSFMYMIKSLDGKEIDGISLCICHDAKDMTSNYYDLMFDFEVGSVLLDGVSGYNIEKIK